MNFNYLFIIMSAFVAQASCLACGYNYLPDTITIDFSRALSFERGISLERAIKIADDSPDIKYFLHVPQKLHIYQLNRKVSLHQDPLRLYEIQDGWDHGIYYVSSAYFNSGDTVFFGDGPKKFKKSDTGAGIAKHPYETDNLGTADIYEKSTSKQF